MKRVLSGLFGSLQDPHFLHHAAGFPFYPVIRTQHGYMGLKSPDASPGCATSSMSAPAGSPESFSCASKRSKLPKLVGQVAQTLVWWYVALHAQTSV